MESQRFRPIHAAGVFLGIALLGTALDLGTKQLAFDNLGMPGEYLYRENPDLFAKYWVWEDVFGFQTSLNQGALFGMGAGTVVWLSLLACVALLGIVGWMLHSAWKSPLMSVVLGMISAGILGNLYDRLGLHGLHWNYADPLHQVGEPVYAVRDWILVMIGSYHWPNFNIADAMLVCGTITLVLHAFFEKDETKSQPHTPI